MGKQAPKVYHDQYRQEHIKDRRRWNRDWIATHKDQYNASKYRYRDRIKNEALSHYSDGDIKCAVCGETDQDVLCLDHINNNGAEHRKKIGISGRGTVGSNTYAALKREKWPKGLQVLCANCNMKKQMMRHRRNRMKNLFYKVVMPGAD